MKIELTKQDITNAIDEFIRTHIHIPYRWFNYPYQLPNHLIVIVADLSLKDITKSTFEDIPF